jgi:hypothetical protein
MTCVFVLAHATLAMLTGVCLVSKFEVIQLEESEKLCLVNAHDCGWG